MGTKERVFHPFQGNFMKIVSLVSLFLAVLFFS